MGRLVPVNTAAGAFGDGAQRHEDAAVFVHWRHIAPVGAAVVVHLRVTHLDDDGVLPINSNAHLALLVPADFVAQGFKDGTNRHHGAILRHDWWLVKAQLLAVEVDVDGVVYDWDRDSHST